MRAIAHFSSVSSMALQLTPYVKSVAPPAYRGHERHLTASAISQRASSDNQ